ncbi:hypothetical protein ACSBL2_11635 [Pedobacter sp. AW31-3R]|uniref:hypothetical protein n=1 Tax=Pedobacter sp. AW31-3R TaxID=3445781 RepID=UPI003FA05254
MKRVISKITASFFICFLFLGLSQPVQAQTQPTKFRVVNRTLSLDKNLKVIRLNEIDSVGIAWILNEEFSRGEIEFDVKGIDKYQGSFLGLAFHGADDRTYEAVYFRPFNFRASDTLRKSHAVQYMSNPNYDWPVLREGFPGKYEKEMPGNVDPNGWFHVKLVILAESVRVYINNSKVPVLVTTPLGNMQGKMIGYWVGNGSGGEWKNLHIKKQK